MDGESGWDADRWADALDEYFDEYDDIFTDAAARSPRLVVIDENVKEHPGRWKVTQSFSDPEDNHDFGIRADVDLKASDEAGLPVLRITHVGAL